MLAQGMKPFDALAQNLAASLQAMKQSVEGSGQAGEQR